MRQTKASQAFKIASEAAETRGPGKGALDDPAAGQQDEIAFGGRQFDHFESQAMREGSVRGLGASVALIDVG